MRRRLLSGAVAIAAGCDAYGATVVATDDATTTEPAPAEDAGARSDVTPRTGDGGGDATPSRASDATDIIWKLLPPGGTGALAVDRVLEPGEADFQSRIASWSQGGFVVTSIPLADDAGLHWLFGSKPSGSSQTYEARVIVEGPERIASRFQALAAEGFLVTDVAPRARLGSGGWVVVAVRRTGQVAPYEAHHRVVPVAALASEVAVAAATGFVVTAVGHDSAGSAHLFGQRRPGAAAALDARVVQDQDGPGALDAAAEVALLGHQGFVVTSYASTRNAAGVGSRAILAYRVPGSTTSYRSRLVAGVVSPRDVEPCFVTAARAEPAPSVVTYCP